MAPAAPTRRGGPCTATGSARVRPADLRPPRPRRERWSLDEPAGALPARANVEAVELDEVIRGCEIVARVVGEDRGVEAVVVVIEAGVVEDVRLALELIADDRRVGRGDVVNERLEFGIFVMLPRYVPVEAQMFEALPSVLAITFCAPRLMVITPPSWVAPLQLIYDTRVGAPRLIQSNTSAG